MSAYDGSIRFDTSIDSGGFNRGLARINKSMAGVQKSLIKTYDSYITGVAKIGAKMLTAVQYSSKLSPAMKALFGKIITGAAGAAMALGTVVATAAAVVVAVVGIALAIAAIVAILVLAGIAIFAWAQKFTNTLYKSLDVTSAYRSKVLELKTAFDTLKGSMMALGTTILTAIAPALMTVINWLVKAINYVSMFIAALTGQKQVMQYVSGSAQGTANATGQAAKNTEKMTKAAKGALAAFDQLNVLQMEEPQEESGGGGGAGGNIVMQAVDIDPKILETVEKIKGWIHEIDLFFDNLWFDIKYYAEIAWNWILSVVVAAGNTITNVWNWIKQAAIDTWNWIKQAVADAGAWIKQAWIDVKQFFSDLWEKIKVFAIVAWQKIIEIWGKVKEWFKTNVTDPIKNFFTETWNSIKTKAGDAWTKVIEIWGKVKAWFTEHVTNPIKDAFKTALDWVKTKFETIFTGIKNFVKGIINGLIGLLNGMLRGAVSGLNNLIGAANSAGSVFPGWKPISTVTAPQIPLLAKGAVIPPNSKFLAVLGDQKSQRNIETPEGLLREIIDERLSANQNNQNVTINFAGSMSELIRVLRPEIIRENDRIGASLIIGGATS